MKKQRDDSDLSSFCYKKHERKYGIINMIGVRCMNTELFKMFEEELFDEAKRIVPLVYNNKDLFNFDTKKYKKYILDKYKLFSIDIELLLVELCGMKHDGEDWENDKFDIEKSIEHHCKVLEYDKKEFGANVEETIDLVAKDIIDNYDKYKKQSLFEIMPNLVRKYMNTHNDSVEHKAYVLYLNNSLKKYGKYLKSTNLSDLEDIQY